jgi:ribonuclease P protein component
MRTVRSEGRRGRSGPVMVRATGPSADGWCRVAFAIGRRTGNAVVRNRIRRRLRAALADLARAGEPLPGTLLVTGGEAVARAPYLQVRSDLAQAIARATGRR